MDSDESIFIALGGNAIEQVLLWLQCSAKLPVSLLSSPCLKDTGALTAFATWSEYRWAEVNVSAGQHPFCAIIH